MTENININLRSWMIELRPIALKLIAELQESKAKSDGSPVTKVDTELEKLLRNCINETYPKDGIIGEEFSPHQPDAPRQWIIDPIDGTRNLIAGIPLFTTLVALLEDGIPTHSVMFQPITGELWLGDITAPPTQSPTSTQLTLKEAIFATTSPYLFRENDQPKIAAIAKQAKLTIWGCDGYAYGKLENGSIDLIIESTMQPYDFLPLVPIIKSAGGIITDWQGEELTLKSNGDVIASTSKALHKQAMTLLNS